MEKNKKVFSLVFQIHMLYRYAHTNTRARALVYNFGRRINVQVFTSNRSIGQWLTEIYSPVSSFFYILRLMDLLILRRRTFFKVEYNRLKTIGAIKRRWHVIYNSVVNRAAVKRSDNNLYTRAIILYYIALRSLHLRTYNHTDFAHHGHGYRHQSVTYVVSFNGGEGDYTNKKKYIKIA